MLMKLLLALILFCAVSTEPARSQVSQSTQDWPAWQKVAVGVLGSTSILATVAVIGAASAGSNDGSSDNNNSGSSDGGSSESGSNSDGSSESDSNSNQKKGQGHVEELTDELLVFVNSAGELARLGGGGQETIEKLVDEYPVLMNYYLELIVDHPEVIEEIDRTVEGETLVDRLNAVMLVHLFSE